MSKVNIPKSVNDPSYRYKRDTIKVEIQNNNGGMTKLINIEAISTQIGTDVDILLKFIKKSLNVNIIKKDSICIRKIETQQNIENILEEYIEKEILCKKCNNPEFTLIKDKKNTTKTCKACGHSIIL
jgi:translation initiation factor 5